jgi:hypothetical protein
MMVTDPYLTTAALGLAYLEYTIGAMLKVAPYRGYKAAGAEMMENGFLSMVLITTISVILLAWGAVIFVVYSGQPMDAVYKGYYDYIVATKNGTFSLLMVIAGVLWAVGMSSALIGIIAPGSQPLLSLSLVFQSQMSPWISMLQATFSLMVVLESIAHIIQDNLLVFVSWGCVLYAVPKRLTRAAGGALIAWPLVFYFGLPFLPTFVNMYGTATFSGVVCSTASCPAFNTLGVGSSNWWAIVSSLTTLGMTISDDAASLIWMNFMLPVLWITILSMAAAGVGRLFGGYVNLIRSVL